MGCRVCCVHLLPLVFSRNLTCAFSGPHSFYDYRPTTDPTNIKLSAALDELHAFETIRKCANAYSASSCGAQFELAPPAGGSILSVDVFHLGREQILSVP
jgi:hypothetical protein